MKVQELLDILADVPGDFDVRYDQDDGWDEIIVSTVDVMDSEKRVLLR